MSAMRFDPYAPTPNWQPPVRDDAPTPNQFRDWTPPSTCDTRNPYWSSACMELPRSQAPAQLVVEDESAFASVGSLVEVTSAARTSTDVPEPGLLVLFAIGAAGVARRLRRG